jgi:iron-sulfur cluster assembly protein
MNPVTISEKAVEEIKKIMQNKNVPEDYGLRVGIKGGGGCSGVSYLLGFDRIKDNDVAYEISNIPVFIEKKHTMYVIGMEIDFYEGADARGFTFVNTQLSEEN